jgi:hypothetical protein
MDTFRRSHIVIGLSLANAEYVSTRHPGWDSYSWGFSSIDGKIYHDEKYGKAYASGGFTYGDTIGCGVIYCNSKTDQQQIFFTKNGKNLGIGFSIHSRYHYTSFYPAVGLHSNHDRVTANFGQSKFIFDLQSLIDEQNTFAKKQIAQIPVSSKELHSWIREYMYISGYTDTLQCFDHSSKATDVNNIEADELTQRITQNAEITKYRKRKLLIIINYTLYSLLSLLVVCQSIESGNITEALNIISSNFSFVTRSDHLMIRLHCQYIIEAVRNNKILEALEYAQQNMQSYMDDFSVHTDTDDEDEIMNDIVLSDREGSDNAIIIDSIGLLAYIDPHQSPVSYLFKKSVRCNLSQAVNQSILHHMKEPTHSQLERAQMQIQILSDVCREQGLGAFHFTPNSI